MTLRLRHQTPEGTERMRLLITEGERNVASIVIAADGTATLTTWPGEDPWEASLPTEPVHEIAQIETPSSGEAQLVDEQT